MAKKLPAHPTKVWTPDDPLKVDFDKFLQKIAPADSIAKRLERTDNPLFSKDGNAKRPPNSAKYSKHNRQKKG
jgi:hypothetical protein